MMNLTANDRVIRLLRVALGVVFVTAGLGKVFMFGEFAGTVSSILRVHGIAPGLIAGLVLLIELSGGAALLVGYRTALSGSLLFLAVCIFVLVLSSAIVQGKEIQCHCFGVLNIRLSNREELILDIILLNLLALLSFLSARKSRTRHRRIPLTSLAVIVFFILIQYSVFGRFFSSGKTLGPEPLPAVTYCEGLNQEFANFRRGNRLLFLVDFPDFNCPPCFDDFMTLCDAVKKRFPVDDSARCFLLFRQGEMANPGNPERLFQWIRASGLRVPAAIGPDSLFEASKFEKSSVVVIGPSGRTLFRKNLPIGAENQDQVLRLLGESHAASP